jgi:hypothetical protein
MIAALAGLTGVAITVIAAAALLLGANTDGPAVVVGTAGARLRRLWSAPSGDGPLPADRARTTMACATCS